MSKTLDPAEIFPWSVPEDAAGARLDQLLVQAFPEISRSQWAKRVEEGRVLVDAQVSAPSFKPKAGQVLSWSPAEAVAAPADSMKFEGEEPEVLFEDDDIVVVNKPEGLTVHAGAGVPTSRTLVGWLLASGRVRSDDGLDPERPGIVHRLDRGTSGVMVVAKHASAHAALARQFESRQAGRLYWAVVEGRVQALFQKRPVRLEKLLHRDPPSCALRLIEDGIASFTSLLSRDSADRTRFRVSHDQGKRALTHFLEVARNQQFSLLELKLGTGRTHQIRVHLSFLGFPIVGDGAYGGRGHPRILLHAHTLQLRHPRSEEAMEFHAPWPASAAAWLTAEGLGAQTRSPLWDTLEADSSSDSNKDGLED